MDLRMLARGRPGLRGRRGDAVACGEDGRLVLGGAPWRGGVTRTRDQGGTLCLSFLMYKLAIVIVLTSQNLVKTCRAFIF